MLPKIDVPIFELTLPSTGKQMRYRPFLVKEEKLFLMAAEANDIKTVVDAIRQVINNCCLDEIDVEKLPIYDIEYIFLKLRARSISEIVNLKYRCFNEIADDTGEKKQCTGTVEFDIDLLSIEPTKNETHTNKIEINEKLGVVMKYPSFDLLNDFATDINNEKLLELILSCIDYIYDEESIYHAKDSTKEELVEFVDSLPAAAFTKIQDFFETMPKIKHTIHFECPKCTHKEDIVIEGVQSFFV
jgi:hypothetical protein